MKTRLTELAVARLRPPKDKAFEWYADELLPSFGLRVYRTGRKTWGVTRRWPGGSPNPTFRPFGEYHPEDLNLADARARAREIIADPGSLAKARERQAEPQPEPEPERADTFRFLAKQFLDHGRTKRGRELRSATVKGYRRALLTYCAALHDRPVGEVRRADAAAVLRATAASAGATSAMRARAAGSRFYSWLIANGHELPNPFTGTEGYDTPKRSRVLTDSELAALWAATEGRRDFALIIRLCLWTGARRSEVGGMSWSELSDGTWGCPGSRTKNHRTLLLPLPKQARAALEGWPRVLGKDTLFGRGRNGFQAWSKSKERLDTQIARGRTEQRLGRPLEPGEQPAPGDYLDAWDLHDVRRTVETRMASLGIPKEHVNKVLNHADGPITAAYDQWSYRPEKAAALQAWADELEPVVARGSSVVVPLRQQRK